MAEETIEKMSFMTTLESLFLRIGLLSPNCFESLVENLNYGAVCMLGKVSSIINNLHTHLKFSTNSIFFKNAKTVNKKFSRPWYDAEVKSVIQSRRDAFKVIKTSTTRQNWEVLCPPAGFPPGGEGKTETGVGEADPKYW